MQQNNEIIYYKITHSQQTGTIKIEHDSSKKRTILKNGVFLDLEPDEAKKRGVNLLKHFSTELNKLNVENNQLTSNSITFKHKYARLALTAMQNGYDTSLVTEQHSSYKDDASDLLDRQIAIMEVVKERGHEIDESDHSAVNTLKAITGSAPPDEWEVLMANVQDTLLNIAAAFRKREEKSDSKKASANPSPSSTKGCFWCCGSSPTQDEPPAQKEEAYQKLER